MTLYRTIVADPPWRYTKDPTERQHPLHGGASAEHYYPTLTVEEVRDLPIAGLAEDRAHLYLWVTNPVLLGLRPSTLGLASVLKVVRAWGFEPVTLLTSVKAGRAGAVGGGLGFYFRGATEHVIFATRGGLGIPAAIRGSRTSSSLRVVLVP